MGRREPQLLSRRRAVDTPRSDMDYLIPMTLLCLSALVSADEPLAEVMLRRRNAYPVYARDFADDYEPYAVAAIPVHAHQVPIFQVISPTAYSGKLRKPVKRPQPNRDLHAYASSHIEQAYQPYAYNHVYEESVPQKYKVNPYEEASSVVVYARPNKNGGYTYRKQPAPTPASHTPQEPIIIRIHKYRVIH